MPTDTSHADTPHRDLIEDTHAEAFGASYVRLQLSAADPYWLDMGLRTLCGYGTSVIGCDCEIGVEQISSDRQTASVLAFAFTSKGLGKAITKRFGQCGLTCPTLVVADGLPAAEKRSPFGEHLRYFGDGFAHLSEEANEWVVPVMEGEIQLPATLGIERGIAGGNLILQGVDQPSALAAARRAADAIGPLAGVITPFPGGVCRCGSKVGSRYESLIASTNDAFCPTLRDQVPTRLVPGATAAYEVIINGVDEQAVRHAMKVGIAAATMKSTMKSTNESDIALGPEAETGAGQESGLLQITAGNYGGKLGKTLIPLRELV